MQTLVEQEYKYIQPESLNTFSPSGFPLYKLELKIDAPLMLLCNMDPMNGLCDGTCLRLLRSTHYIVECKVLGGDNANNVVFIPQMALDSGLHDSPILFCCLQFPVQPAYAMTINKSQGQTIKHVGLNLSSSVFSHGQLYVALSRCTYPRNIKILFPHGQEDTKATNVVWTEVFRNLDI